MQIDTARRAVSPDSKPREHCASMRARSDPTGQPCATATRISRITWRSSAASTAPRVRSALAEALAALARALETLDARWYLFGAQAALRYGDDGFQRFRSPPAVRGPASAQPDRPRVAARAVEQAETDDQAGSMRCNVRAERREQESEATLMRFAASHRRWLAPRSVSYADAPRCESSPHRSCRCLRYRRGAPRTSRFRRRP